MKPYALVTATVIATLTASLCLANEFKPSRADVEDYCSNSGRIFIKASIMAKTGAPDAVKKYIKDEVNRTTFVNKTFNSPKMKEFTADKLYEDVPSAKEEINGFMNQKSIKTRQQKEAHLIKSFSDGCVKGFFKEANSNK